MLAGKMLMRKLLSRGGESPRNVEVIEDINGLANTANI